MARSATFTEDVLIAGSLIVTGDNVILPAGKIDNADIAAGAELDASKLVHYTPVVWSQDGTAAAVTEQVVYCCQADDGATLKVVEVGCVTVPTGSATATVNVKKNGTTVLTSTVVIDSANSAYTPEAGTISTSAMSKDDVLTVTVTVSVTGTDTGATGLYVLLGVEEEYPTV